MYCRKITLSEIYIFLSLCLHLLANGEDKPNILLILADDLGYGDVQCYNPESKIPTPHCNRLANEGMLFTDAHSPSTVCTPTRYSILTGRMAFRLNYKGVFTGVGGPCLITPDRLTLPGMLREKGYETAMFGKWHVGISAFEKDGVPIHENGLEAVKRIDYSRPFRGGPVDRGFDHFSERFPAQRLTGSMRMSTAIAFLYRPLKSSIADPCPSILIPVITVRE